MCKVLVCKKRTGILLEAVKTNPSVISFCFIQVSYLLDRCTDQHEWKSMQCFCHLRKIKIYHIHSNKCVLPTNENALKHYKSQQSKSKQKILMKLSALI